MNRQRSIGIMARRLWIRNPATPPINTRCSSFRQYSSTKHLPDDNFERYESFQNRPKTALVVGSSGSLGRTLTKHLSKTLGVTIIGADVAEPKKQDEQYLKGGFVELPTFESGPAGLQDLTMAMTDGLYQLLEQDTQSNPTKLDAVICVAGAWEGDPPALPLNDNDDSESKRMQILEGAHAYAQTIDNMMGKNLYPVLAAGYASQHYMESGRKQPQHYDDHDDASDGCLFVAIGATAALNSTPGMLGYGLSKVATHHYLQTLGETTGLAMTSKSKRQETRSLRMQHKHLQTLSVVGILPTIIDTQANREAMPDANFNEWTKSMDIAKEIGSWLQEPSLRPHSGSLLKVHPNKMGGADFRVAR